MHLPKHTSPVSSRNALKSSASLLTLAVGAVGWSGLAYAAGEETASQVLLLPEHYELMDNGVVVFSLETGENLSLTSDQYLIMEDGLLLITDELAQASVYSLPVMGSIRAQLLSDLAPVATIDGTVAEATPSQTLSITQGTAPRLSEQVDLQSYELAQIRDASTSLSTPGLALLVLMLFAEMGGELDVEEMLTLPDFWTDADIADSASTAITGSSGDSFVGYTAASTSAATDPLSNVGVGSGNTATFDMHFGGNNFFVAGDNAARFSGSLYYTGGSGNDSLTFGDYMAYANGSVTVDMAFGGNNTLVAGDDAAIASGLIAFRGGFGNDSLTFGHDLASEGTATFDMVRGGNNTFVAGVFAAMNNGELDYTGGSGEDSLTFGGGLAIDGTATFDMSLGGNNTFVASDFAAAGAGSIAYTGGSGDDSLTFGTYLAASGTATFDLGSDSAVDTVTFQGTVAASSGNVSISNFDPTDGDTIVLQLFSDTADVTLSASGSSDTLVSASSVAFVISGVVTGSLGLTTNSSGHVVITDAGSIIV